MLQFICRGQHNPTECNHLYQQKAPKFLVTGCIMFSSLMFLAVQGFYSSHNCFQTVILFFHIWFRRVLFDLTDWSLMHTPDMYTRITWNHQVTQMQMLFSWNDSASVWIKKQRLCTWPMLIFILLLTSTGQTETILLWIWPFFITSQ